MNLRLRFVIVAGLVVSMIGCKSESRDQGTPVPVVPDAAATTTDQLDSELPTGTGSDGDAAELERSIESIAKVRRDGAGAIIEVDLRGVDPGETLNKLTLLPKLRSLMLSGNGVTEDSYAVIGRIETLENLDMRGCPVSNQAIGRLAGLQRLKSIRFSGKDVAVSVDDEAMSTLGQLKSLSLIAMDHLPIGDQGLARLEGLSQLRELYLAGSSVTDAGAASLAKFPQLTKLRIAGTAFTSDGLARITHLSKLTELDVSECAGIDDRALPALGQMTALSKLNVYATTIGDADWSQLAKCTELKSLNVDKTAVSDVSLTEIGKLGGLTFLHLGSTAITDQGLEELAGLTQLQQLIVTRTAVTQSGVDRLQSSLPDAKIQLQYVPGN